ncbi:MAG: GH3 auxin-responsive promoter family protein [Bacteroidales bacterium]|nr:MAG: GH3 auxin-responsive promoter family protein [Bacteroidales bacterium]
MPILPSIIAWLNAKRRHRIDRFRKYPFEVQKQVLFKLLDRAKDTEWGRKYDFPTIKTLQDFRGRLPLQTYDDIKPYVRRLRDGEKDILWPGEIKWFAKSSGTTSDKSKFIPVSKEALEDCHYRGGKDVLVIYTSSHPETKIYEGKGLTLGGSCTINNYSNNSYYGDLSAILLTNIPFWADFIRTPPQKIALLDEWENKLEKITETTIKENVTNLAGVPSWNLVMIKYILKKTGKNHLLELWPNLELFIHGGVSFVPYRKQFKKVIPSESMNYMETYNASEGFFSIQDDLKRDDMLLMLDYGVFYEFIPVEELAKEAPSAYTVADVELDKNYAMIISTNGGLWRYIIGDTVVFTSLFPHKIKISGRTKHFINAFGEEIIIDNATRALKIACDKTGAVINEYTAGPVYMDDDKKGHHEWLVEFDIEPEDPDFFANSLDQALISINSDYEAKRYKSITLDKPVVRSMRKGVFYQWFAKKNKLGGQNKIPNLSNDRKYLEEILKINAEMK